MKKTTVSSDMKPFVRNRNLSILIFLLILLGSLLFFRRLLRPAIYMEPQQDGLYLSCYDKDACLVPYQSIRSVSLVESFDYGVCNEGIDDKRVRSGLWENETYGEYRLYAQKNIAPCIVLGTKDLTVVFNYESSDVTTAIFTSMQDLLDEKGVSYEVLTGSDQ